ncbi:MAG: HAD hydrolase-like protein, partial [Patescibacteria group bacterium]
FYHKDNLPFLKPDPRVFNQALMDFSIMPDSAVYLGDSVGDAVSAKSAGLHFIAVLESGLRTKPDFNSVSVDFFADRLPEAYTYISVH